MQYRHIQSKDVKSLPEHINLLRNFQDMHAYLLRIENDFPVLELGSIVPNYETKYNDFVIKGNRLISKYKVNSVLYKIDKDLSVGGFAAERLLNRKNNLIDALDNTIEKWQTICDKIDKEIELEDE